MRGKSGRNHSGQIVVRHKGGRRGCAFLRLDYFRKTFALNAIITGFVRRGPAQPLAALIKYLHGGLSYITAPHGVGPGAVLQTWISFDHFLNCRQPGNVLALKYIQQGDQLFGLYTRAGRRATWARAAGTSCKVLYKTHDKSFFMLGLPSGKEQKAALVCIAVLGRNSNLYHKREVVGKAGANRLAGVRPTVRGVAMNPVDHPHGGRTKTVQPEVSPWGWVAKHNY